MTLIAGNHHRRIRGYELFPQAEYSLNGDARLDFVSSAPLFLVRHFPKLLLWDDKYWKITDRTDYTLFAKCVSLAEANEIIRLHGDGEDTVLKVG